MDAVRRRLDGADLIAADEHVEQLEKPCVMKLYLGRTPVAPVKTPVSTPAATKPRIASGIPAYVRVPSSRLARWTWKRSTSSSVVSRPSIAAIRAPAGPAP